MNNSIVKDNSVSLFNELNTRGLYFIALTISLSSFVLWKTIWPLHQYFEYIAICGLPFLFIRFCAVLFELKIWQIRIVLLTFPCFFITACIVDEADKVIYPYFFVISAYNISFRKIIKYFLLINAAIWLLTTLAAIVHVLPNDNYERETLDVISMSNSGDTVRRYAFGYNYPTDYASHLTYICIMWFVTRGRNVRYYDYILFLLGAIHVYRNCDARLDTICIILTVLLFFIYNNSSHSKLWSQWFFKIIVIYATVIAAALIIIFTFQYAVDPTDEVMNIINILLSGRLSLGADALDEYGISVFGQYIKFYHEDSQLYNFIDSSYVQLLLVYGVLYFTFAIFCHIYVCKKNVEKSQLYLPLAMGIVSLHSIVFQGLMNFQFNPFYLGLFAIQDITMMNQKEIDVSAYREGMQ